jgi:aminoglycoside 3-N-acetyltransferase
MRIDRKAVTAAFEACGVARGECLMLHADALVVAQMTEGDLAWRMNELLGGVLDALGDGGTLIMPTFTYSATKGEPFNPRRTPSEVGMLTEHFRLLPGVLRTRHPIFSVASRGRLAPLIAQATIHDCFGKDTVFDLLVRHDAWLACLACPFDRLTFIHHVEQSVGVDYRYFKHFPFEIISDDAVERGVVRYYVRDLERRTAVRLAPLRDALAEAGLLKTADIGRAQLSCVRCRDFMHMACKLLESRNNILIEEGAQSET